MPKLRDSDTTWMSKRLGRQGVRHGQAVIAAAVIDIDHFGRKAALLPQLAGNLGEPRVELRQAGALVEHRHDDRQPGLGLRPGGIRRESGSAS